MAKKTTKKKAKKKDCSINPMRMPIPKKLRARAKRIGFSDEQIANYTDPERLAFDCNQIKPQQTVDKPRVKQIKIVADKPKGEPAQVRLDTEITEIRATHVRRCAYDEQILNSYVIRNRIKDIQKVTIVRDCVLNDKGMLKSQIVIDYLKG